MLASLGEVESQLGQPELAGPAFERALSLIERLGDPESLHVCRLKLTRYQFENGRLRDALETGAAEYAWARGLLDRKESGWVPGRVAVQYARTSIAHGDVAQGLAVLETARVAMPHQTMDSNAQFWAAHADAMLALQRLDEAGADVDRAVSKLSAAGEARVAQSVYVARRRYWVATGKADQALQDFAARAPKVDETTTVYTALRRQAEEATLRLAAGDLAAARTTAEAALATIDRLPERRFIVDAEAGLTTVRGEALLREGRAAEALPVLQKALSLNLAVYEPAHSPDVHRVRLALAEAERRRLP